MHNRLPHACDLRKGRRSLPNHYYLLTTVTDQRQAFFTDYKAARLLISVLRSAHQKQWVTSLAFVVMPDHLHWLIALGETKPLPQLMQHVKGHSSYQLNQYLDHREHPIWQAGYHDHALRKEEDVKATARYIIANPLRAGLVEKIGDYPHWDAIWL